MQLLPYLSTMVFLGTIQIVCTCARHFRAYYTQTDICRTPCPCSKTASLLSGHAVCSPDSHNTSLKTYKISQSVLKTVYYWIVMQNYSLRIDQLMHQSFTAVVHVDRLYLLLQYASGPSHFKALLHLLP